MPPTTDRDAAAVLGRIRLRHLQCVLAVVRTGTLGGAAQALAITQPAVTKTLNELEALLGKRLFVRSRTGATLTAEAEVFLLHATASLESLARAVHGMLLTTDEAPLRVGVLPTLTPSFMPLVLQAFAASRPGATLRVLGGRNKDLLGWLREGELDLVLGRMSDPDAMAGISFEPLFAEPLVIALRHGHPFAARHARRKAPLHELSQFPLVLPQAGTLIRQVADGFLARHGVVPANGLLETLETPLARALVLAGDSAWVIPLGAVQPDLAAGTMTRLAVDITPEEPVGLLLRTDTVATPSLQALMQAARAQARKRRHNRR